MVQPGASEADGEITASVGKPQAAGETGLQAEYQYVISDLKRIGIIAAVMLGLLIVLAIVLT
jgi:hypothetical protein